MISKPKTNKEKALLLKPHPYIGLNIETSSVAEVSYRGLLEENEVMLAMFDGTLLDERGQRVGGLAMSDFVILTNQRLVTWARGLWVDTIDGFSWQNVEVAEANNWDPIHGFVRFSLQIPGSSAQRKRRINVRGSAEVLVKEPSFQVVINTLDYMPAEEAPLLAEMMGWMHEQAKNEASVEELIRAFANRFPRNETFEARPMLHSEVKAAPQKRHWWAFWETDAQNQKTESVGQARNIVAAYEKQRKGIESPFEQQRPTRSTPLLPPLQSPGGVLQPLATISSPLGDQFGIYGFSRGLRLLLEVPRRVGGSIYRAGEVMSGTTELIGNMQDPKVRRNALTGMSMALDTQVQRSTGPLAPLMAPLTPLMRAFIQFGQHTLPPLDEEASTAASNNSRRIQVRTTAGLQRGGIIKQVDPTLPNAQAPQNAKTSGASRRIRLQPTSPQAANPNRSQPKVVLPTIQAQQPMHTVLPSRRTETPPSPSSQMFQSSATSLPTASPPSNAETKPSKGPIIRARANIRRSTAGQADTPDIPEVEEKPENLLKPALPEKLLEENQPKREVLVGTSPAESQPARVPVRRISINQLNEK